MSTAAAQGAGRTGPGSGIAIAAVLLVVIGLVWLLASGERELRRTATGFAGLVDWLDANDVPARTFTGSGYLVQGEVGLRVLPLYDTDLTEARTRPTTPEEVIVQTSETDMSVWVVSRKIRLLPTLVVLPKWRTGMRALGVAHRDLLIPGAVLDRLVRQIPGLSGHVRQDPAGYVRGQGPQGRAIGLFHPQSLAGSGCEPVIGTGEALLLGRCALTGGGEGGGAPTHFWLLADPDLMDNHGLTLAENAAVALAFVRDAAHGQPVVLDLSDGIYTVTPEQLDRGRTWADLARLFEWPFRVVWIAFGAVAALVLWRALVRYGPVARVYEDAPRAAKEVSIDAKARLLRLAGQDAALLSAHIQARLQQLAAEILGPHRPAERDPLAVLTALVGRRSPGLARELAEAALPPRGRTDPAGLLARLDRFETCLQRIRDEFGRAAGARG